MLLNYIFFTRFFLIIFSTVALISCSITASANRPPITVTLTCINNPTCEFTGTNIPIVVTIKNETGTEIGVPTAYLQQTGPSIKLTDTLTQRTTNLKVNLGQRVLLNNYTKIAPGRTTSIKWYIAPFELMQFAHEKVDLTAQATISTFIKMSLEDEPIAVSASSSVKIASKK